MISFQVFVPGLPITQGSKRQVKIQHGPRKGESLMIEDRDKELKAWRKDVALAVLAARRRGAWLDPSDEKNRHVPFKITALFIVPRPESDMHNAENVIPHLSYKVPKGKAAKRPTKKPDVDKLVRAVGDSLKEIVWKDDAQMVSLEAYKFYGQGVKGVWLKFEQLDPMHFPAHLVTALQLEGLSIVGVDVVGKKTRR